MAENEQEEAIEEVADDRLKDEEGEGSSEEEVKIKGIPKSLLIKIAIGLGAVLIIGGGIGAYFYFMADEPIVEELSTELTEEGTDTNISSEDTVDMDNLIDVSGAQPAIEVKLSDKEKILQMREDAVTLQEENLRLKMQLSEIEGDKPEEAEVVDGAEVQPAEDAVEEGASNSSEKPGTKKYLDLYGEEAQTYPNVRIPKAEPIPDPKWGD